MVNEQLVDFITKNLKSGYDKEKIISVLKGNGFDDSAVSEAFASVEANASSGAAAASVQPAASTPAPQAQPSVAPETGASPETQATDAGSANKRKTIILTAALALVIIASVIGAIVWMASPAEEETPVQTANNKTSLNPTPGIIPIKTNTNCEGFYLEDMDSVQSLASIDCLVKAIDNCTKSSMDILDKESNQMHTLTVSGAESELGCGITVSSRECTALPPNPNTRPAMPMPANATRLMDDNMNKVELMQTIAGCKSLEASSVSECQVSITGNSAEIDQTSLVLSLYLKESESSDGYSITCS